MKNLNLLVVEGNLQKENENFKNLDVSHRIPNKAPTVRIAIVNSDGMSALVYKFPKQSKLCAFSALTRSWQTGK